MKFHRKTSRKERKVFSSWTNESDPSPGRYSMGVDPRGAPQIVIWDGPNRRWRSGYFDGVEFTGVPNVTRSTFFSGFRIQKDNDGRLVITYTASNTSSLVRFQLTMTGSELQQRWDEDKGHDTVYTRRISGLAVVPQWHAEDLDWRDVLGGQNWNAGAIAVFRGMIVQKMTGSLALQRVKLPDYADIADINIDECKIRCLNDCSCNAYAFVRGINCDLNAEGHQGNGSELAFVSFSFSMVATATDDFSLANKLGQGGFGPSLLKGRLPCGQEVAAKGFLKSLDKEIPVRLEKTAVQHYQGIARGLAVSPSRFKI
ncbi:hypothetical protein HAX54_029969 [Datura stramonium]|uniref:Apple domain-containing protein n=1 Tax=Datura stramonium TaxID=4076 RepID=A0ABS8V6W3_DATST|nr:hypothetical protein [Datura stramonium]